MVNWTRSLAYTFLILYAFTVLLAILIPVWGAQWSMPLILLVSLSTLFFFLFALTHGWHTLGGRRLLTLLGLTFAVTMLMESIGVLTGWPFGPYRYTHHLGPLLFGLVPVLIPVAWFMMVYTAQQVVEQIAAPFLSSHLTVVRGLWLIGVQAMALTAWDLVMDPLMVSRAHWVWAVRGAYFGIPVQNYVGWMLTALLIYGLYYLIHRPGPRSQEPGWRALPVWAYTLTWIANVGTAALGGFAGPALVGFFAMGAFALLGLGTLLGAPGTSRDEEGDRR